MIPSLGAADLDRLVSLDLGLELIDAAMRELSAGSVLAPERWAIPVSDYGRMAFMPGASPMLGRFGIKVLSLFPASMRGELPSHQGVMVLFDVANGRPLCVIEANALTSLRTAAASAVATRALARTEASTLAILGCGEQARLHIDAIARVRPVRQLRLWNRTAERAERLADHYRKTLEMDVTVTRSSTAAVEAADIICTLTGADEPILFGAELHSGQHLNIVGSSRDGPREIDDQGVALSRYFADSRAHALSQGAELRHAIGAGLVTPDHLLGEIGDVLDSRVPGRTSDTDITLYKSLGHVIQDLAVADAAYRRSISLVTG
jgi:ornithine cyclodeaminase